MTIHQRKALLRGDWWYTAWPGLAAFWRERQHKRRFVILWGRLIDEAMDKTWYGTT